MTPPAHRLILDVPGSGAVEALATQPPHADLAFVCAHGAGADMHHAFMGQVAAGLAARRIAVLRFQFPYAQAGRRRVDAPAVAHATVRAAVAQAADHWPSLPLLAGGKSFGGRMASQAQAERPMARVVGLVFLGFPLHPADKPSCDRAEHLSALRRPMLFVRGTRDALAEPGPMAAVLHTLGYAATHADIAGADHGFGVLRRSGRDAAEVLDEVLDWVAVWARAAVLAAGDQADDRTEDRTRDPGR